MSRLIDADALIKYLNDNRITSNSDAINEQLTADAVPVVRCKDCKYRTDGKCFFTDKAKDPDYCCSFGEKVTKSGMKKFFVLSRCSPEYHRIVEAEDISEVADRYHDSCYGIVEILQDEVTE